MALVTDFEKTFVLFLYNQIQWIKDPKETTFQGEGAAVSNPNRLITAHHSITFPKSCGLSPNYLID